MASQVLSGASNPSYTNNTGQNVRVVINYMEGTPFTPARFGTRPFGGFGGGQQFLISNAVPATLTINWAGVSVSNQSSNGNLAIGRNLAYSQLYRDTASGGTQSVFVGLQRTPSGDIAFDSDGDANEIFQAVGVNNAVALTAVSNNAVGTGIQLPTELMLAPGQTFSAVCGVHNIVVIPENG